MTNDAISRMEQLIGQDVGRGIGEMAKAASGGLLAAASDIANHPAPKVGIITGFFIPHATPPAAENDGPIGAAHLAAGLGRAGIDVRIATDAPCQGVLQAAIDISESHAPLDVIELDGANIQAVVDVWKADAITHAIAIERCGPNYDGRPHNARGQDISAHTGPLDQLFGGANWATIAIGDGGNELGMGALNRDLIATHIEHGHAIACATPADHLIVAGVSNWGGWAMLCALALLMPQKRDALTHTLEPQRELDFLRHINQHGPSVDGMSASQREYVDGLEWKFHAEVMQQLLGILT